MNLQIDRQYIADLVPGNVVGQKAVGKHRLVLPLKFNSLQWSGNSDLVLLGMSVDCTLDGAAGGPLGRFVQQREGVVLRVRSGVPAGSPTAYFVLDLDPRQMEVVEDVRQGGDLEAMLDVRALAQTGATFVDVFCQIRHSISRDTWIRVMDASAYRQSLLLEVRLVNPAAEGVYKYLRAAESHFRRADYDESVSQCRRAIEAVGTLTNTEDKRAHLKQSLDRPETAEAMTLDDRLLAVRYALKHVCNPSHHADANSQAIHYDREDARMVLHATAAVLGHYLAGPGRAR